MVSDPFSNGFNEQLNPKYELEEGPLTCHGGAGCGRKRWGGRRLGRPQTKGQ